MDKDVLRRHIGLIHENKTPLECIYCYAVFIEEKRLIQHRVAVHGEVPKEKNPTHKSECHICHATFRKNFEVNRHIEEVHEGKKPFTCTICNSSFSKKTHLVNHVASVHEKRKPFSCHLCKKSFPEKSTLTKHILGVHEKKKPHKCPMCPAAFLQKSHLQPHIDSVHLGRKDESKKVKCDHCDTIFCSMKTMKKHVEIVHEGKKPFECTFCDKKFAIKGGLITHLRSMHDHGESLNKITQRARDYVRNVFNSNQFSSRHHRNAVALETEAKMRTEVKNEFGEPLFKPEEYLDISQIKTLFYNFKQNERMKEKRRESDSLDMIQKFTVEENLTSKSVDRKNEKEVRNQ